MGVSAHWLGTGVGPMLQSEREKVLNQRLDAVKTTTQLVAGLDLPEDKLLLIRDILYAAQIGDMEMIKESLDSYEALRPDQKALLDNLEHCTQGDQDTIKRMASLAAKGAEAKTTASSQAKFVTHGDVGQQLHGSQTLSNFTIDMRKNKKEKE